MLTCAIVNRPGVQEDISQGINVQEDISLPCSPLKNSCSGLTIIFEHPRSKDLKKNIYILCLTENLGFYPSSH